MTQQIIGVGTLANDGTGDTRRAAFQKVNANFTELYGWQPSFRNLLRNASFAINQRVVSGTVTLAAGAYGHDGVKAGAAGATYTFAASGIDTAISVTAGSLVMPIEGALIEGGAYVLSHEGTAQGRIWQTSASGDYASVPTSGLVVSGLAAATLTAVEFSSGTILRPQFEPRVVTPFERRHVSVELAICERYYEKSYSLGTAPGSNVGAGQGRCLALGASYWASGFFTCRKRVLPAMTLYDNAGNSGKVSYFASSVWNNAGATNGLGPAGDKGWQITGGIAGASFISFDWVATAEI